MSTITEPTVELTELGKFFTVTARRWEAGQTAPQMFSTAIDAAWHQLTENPEAHRAFAQKHAGQSVAHAENKGEGFISWVSAYEEAYGSLPEIWFTNADGSISTEALDRYHETGQVWAEWDCSPAPGDGDDLTAETTIR